MREILSFEFNTQDFLDMNLLSITDLCDRWIYTKAGIHKLVRKEDFPKPFGLVSRKKVKIFKEEDIKIYEHNKPWLFNQELKKQRQNLFLILSNNKI
jgi:hypothetical protein